MVGVTLAEDETRRPPILDDPYLWLEEVEGKRALEWVKQRYPKLDVHLAMFACQKLGFFEAKNEPTGEMHAFNLMTALHLGASLASAAEVLDELRQRVEPGLAVLRCADCEQDQKAAGVGG